MSLLPFPNFGGWGRKLGQREVTAQTLYPRPQLPRLPAEARGGAGLPWPRPMPRPRGKVSCVGAAAGIAEQGAQSRVAPSSADLRVSAPAGCQVLLGAAEATGEGG